MTVLNFCPHCGKSEQHEHQGKMYPMPSNLPRQLRDIAHGMNAPANQAAIREAAELLERAAVPPPDVRALFNKGIGVQKGNKFSFSFETEEEANRAFHFIAHLGNLETTQPPVTKSAVCGTCNGRREVGGFVNADSGYQTDPCPDCTATDQKSTTDAGETGDL